MYLPVSVPIIKPVNSSCNLECSYCYARNLEKKFIKKDAMSFETLKRTIDFFCQQQNYIEFKSYSRASNFLKRNIAPCLSKGSLLLPHFGDITHTGHPFRALQLQELISL